MWTVHSDSSFDEIYEGIFPSIHRFVRIRVPGPDILNQAKTVDDIIKVEQALSNIRMQIEQLQGQLKLWNHEVAFSTIQVQLQTKPNPVNIDEPWQPVSWGKTWEAAQNAILKTISSIWNALNYLVVGLGYALPFMILGGAGYFGYRQWRKSRSK